MVSQLNVHNWYTYCRESLCTLEIGAGIGGHLEYENLTNQDYTCLELREECAEIIVERYPKVKVVVVDCQKKTEFADNYFDRIIAVHVLEHLPNLPACVSEMHRISKPNARFQIVIPALGGLANGLASRISARRIFEKKYKQSYDWFINREHINTPEEIFEELSKYYTIDKKEYFPLKIPSKHFNIAIGVEAIKK